MRKDEVRQQYRRITEILIKKNITIATMESCTGGLIASLLTDTEGASGIFFGGMVTYSNEAKIKAGVLAETIDTYGVYSKETATAMAKTCREYYGTQMGVGVTGSLGNVDPANGDSVPGEVYLAVVGEKLFQKKIILIPERNRFSYKIQVAEEVGRMIWESIHLFPEREIRVPNHRG